MRMIPARFVRVPRWIPCYFITHNLLIFQEIMSISKTCNQLIGIHGSAEFERAAQALQVIGEHDTACEDGHQLRSGRDSRHLCIAQGRITRPEIERTREKLLRALAAADRRIPDGDLRVPLPIGFEPFFWSGAANVDPPPRSWRAPGGRSCPVLLSPALRTALHTVTARTSSGSRRAIIVTSPCVRWWRDGACQRRSSRVKSQTRTPCAIWSRTVRNIRNRSSVDPAAWVGSSQGQ